jgi:hypothetical protein
MALFTPSESPGIVVKEIDLTGVVPNVQTTTGAYVGNFRWGPAEVVTLVNNEATLVSKFASPNDDNSIDFHTAAYFLRYSNSLQVVREVTSAAVNSYDSDADSAALLQLLKTAPILMAKLQIVTLIIIHSSVNIQVL